MTRGTDRYKIGNRATTVALFLFYLFFLVSCSTATRQLFFDIPAPSPEELAEKAQLEQERREAVIDQLENQETDSKSLFSSGPDSDQPRPEIESLKTWEEVLEVLPKDYKDKADWAAAYEQGLVKPRAGSDPMASYAAAFRYDFIIEAEKPKNEAYFPHSAHTPWLGCMRTLWRRSVSPKHCVGFRQDCSSSGA